ncbi:hypothetical protein [Paenibacillus validus]|uniref:Uncharacterized protein n=1 Tax=Paenibacillus validus TaxID=44253 RepID=A0A7X2ZCU0_9BACL|nr:hypothetical protein [Paenibacillus validus]MUG71945.1 hypothetical protein [Paenibacillus validus]
MNYVVEFIKSIFPDTSTAFFVIALTLFSLWMYKEMRSSFVEGVKNNAQRADKAIDCYAELELEILKLLNEKSDHFAVAEKVSKASSLMPYALLKKCNGWKDESDTEKQNEILKEIHKELRNEILSLKLKQSDPITYKTDDTFVDFIAVYVKTKLAPIGLPFLHTFINLCIIFFIFLYGNIVINESLMSQKVLYISLIFVGILYFLLLNIIISLVLFKGRFKHSILNWVLFSVFIILPILLFFVGPWYRGIISIVFLFAYAFYMSKYSIRSEQKIFLNYTSQS